MKLIKDAGPTMLTIWALLLLTALVSLGLARWSLAFVSVATLGLSLCLLYTSDAADE